MLVQVYRKEAVNRKRVYEWFKRFREGRETAEDEPRSSRPSTSRIPEMIDKVRQMLEQDQRLTLRLIGEELGISKDTAHTIVRDDLSKSKICFQFVSHKLTGEQKETRMETSGNLIFTCNQDPLLLKTTSREMSLTSSIRNQNGNGWRGGHRIPRDQKSSLQISKVKALLKTLFHNKDIIRKQFVPADQTINAAKQF